MDSFDHANNVEASLPRQVGTVPNLCLQSSMSARCERIELLHHSERIDLMHHNGQTLQPLSYADTVECVTNFAALAHMVDIRRQQLQC